MPVEKKKIGGKSSLGDMDEDENKKSLEKISSSTKSTRKTKIASKGDCKSLMNSPHKNSVQKLATEDLKHKIKESPRPNKKTIDDSSISKNI